MSETVGDTTKHNNVSYTDLNPHQLWNCLLPFYPITRKALSLELSKMEKRFTKIAKNKYITIKDAYISTLVTNEYI